MLIYNSKKEFIGIEENDLKMLGFENFSELKKEAIDFADLFVKTPGHIHNFKHVSWIDYIACDDSINNPKVIIHTSNGNFKCTIDIKIAFLDSDPFSKAFLVSLNNFRKLTSAEQSDISLDLKDRASLVVAKTEEIAVQKEPEDELETQEEILEKPEDELEIKEEVFEKPEDEPETQEEVFEETSEIEDEASKFASDETIDSPIDLDTPLDINFDEDKELTFDTETQEETYEDDEDSEDKIDLELEYDSQLEQEYEEFEIYDNGYIYDPQVASNELGLPIDLIEEFIEDFIAQANEFKPQLYSSLDNGEFDNVKILSHKLKGVAANLRIEDAFETLTLINTSENPSEILTNLDILYKIISKLSGEKIKVTKKKTQPQQSTPSELKDEKNVLTPIDDSEVPSKIDIPELADDEFFTQDDEVKIELDDTLNIETISEEEAKSIEDESLSIDDIDFSDEYNTEKNDNETSDIDDSNSNTITYDKKIVANEIGIPYDNFLELFDDYITDIQEISSDISDAIGANDSKTWRTKAVLLKGMSDNMRMNELAKELEKLIRAEDAKTAIDAYEIIDKSIVEISHLKG